MTEDTEKLAQDPVAQDLVGAMVDIAGEHAGRRAAHAKGTWAEGTFTATPEAAALSTVPHLSGEEIPALVRFSKASGKPEVHDGARDGGGMATKLRPPGGEEWDIVATGTPVFVTRTPEDFLELLRLRKPDAETGQPDMEALGRFLGEHPEAQLSIQSTMGTEPPASFLKVRYFSPHAFKLTGADGTETWVKWRWRPAGGEEERLPDDDARARGRDYLREDLAARLRERHATMELEFQLAGEGDSTTDPTQLWEGEPMLAARLELTGVVDDPERDGRIDVFDPNRLPEGIEPSDDPILAMRSKAYSVSAYRRWDREA